MHDAGSSPSGCLRVPGDGSLAASDARPVRVLTRGNVDGIVASALCLAAFPDARVSYVASAAGAVDLLRRDLSTRQFYVVDLGLTPDLLRAVNRKAATEQRVTLVDHHQQTGDHLGDMLPHVEAVFEDWGSAASVALHHLEASGLVAPRPAQRALVGVADLVEFGVSPYLVEAMARHGLERLQEEAEQLDFAWRLAVEDDRFRLGTARRLARGAWPSEVPEVRARYLQVLRENRWVRAKERVRSHLEVRNHVALLSFGKRRTSLLGFGARALTSVAREEGARVAVLVNRRGGEACVALRAVSESPLNLGRFVEMFTRQHGVAGGGHPTSAGARIPTKALARFVDDVCMLA